MADSISKDFFLGGLSDAEAAEFELQILENATFAEQVSIFEEKLIEAYLGRELTPEDESRFKTSYLVTDERIKNVEMISQLHRIASELVESRTDGREADSLTTGVMSWIRSLGLEWRLASVAIILIFAALSIWLVFRPTTDDAMLTLQARYEKINQDQNYVDRGSNITDLSLLSDNLRSMALPSEVLRAGLSNEVRIRLALGENADNSAKYNVTILRDSIIVFRQAGISPFAQSSVPEIRLILPREIFTEGKYGINLTNENNRALNYQFVVR